jgi:hypothetical protein
VVNQRSAVVRLESPSDGADDFVLSADADESEEHDRDLGRAGPVFVTMFSQRTHSSLLGTYTLRVIVRFCSANAGSRRRADVFFQFERQSSAASLAGIEDEWDGRRWCYGGDEETVEAVERGRERDVDLALDRVGGEEEEPRREADVVARHGDGLDEGGVRERARGVREGPARRPAC